MTGRRAGSPTSADQSDQLTLALNGRARRSVPDVPDTGAGADRAFLLAQL